LGVFSFLSSLYIHTGEFPKDNTEAQEKNPKMPFGQWRVNYVQYNFILSIFYPYNQ
jgi:hypothetical protein